MGGIIDTVEPGSIAEQLDWQPGDQIISINGHILSDLIDYRFYCADEHLSVLVRRGMSLPNSKSRKTTRLIWA